MYNFNLFILFFIPGAVFKLINLPLSINRYDSNDVLLEEEDKRDLFRDIKTVYAPEYRIYANGSIGSPAGKEKRDIHEYYNPKDYINKCSMKKKKSSSTPLEEKNFYKLGKNKILEIFDIDNDLLDISDDNKWLNQTNFDRDIPKGQDIGLFRNVTNISSLDLSVFWHSQMSTREIRKLQGI